MTLTLTLIFNIDANIIFYLIYVNIREKNFKIYIFFLICVNFMLIYVNIIDRQTDGKTYQNYSSEPHKKETNPTRHTE
jgi:hypothetical protein